LDQLLLLLVHKDADSLKASLDLHDKDLGPWQLSGFDLLQITAQQLQWAEQTRQADNKLE
jgi:hypothetical protein